ncbi:MAG: hypothetical protein AVDCRST_MAG03-998, partial [uncultured Rubrobacteraceae bacterium]
DACRGAREEVGQRRIIVGHRQPPATEVGHEGQRRQAPGPRQGGACGDRLRAEDRHTLEHASRGVRMQQGHLGRALRWRHLVEWTRAGVWRRLL